MAKATQRALLAADVLRLAGFADAAIVTARRLGAPIPTDVRRCPKLWREWGWQLADWGDDA